MKKPAQPVVNVTLPPMNIDIEPKLSEEEVWVRAWCFTANATTCHTADIAASWADKCLKDFQKRFKKASSEP